MIDLNDEGILNMIQKAMSFNSETNRVEFKDARSGIPKDLWQSISGFSNCPGGGIIIFGVKEDRRAGSIEVVGGLDLASLQEGIHNYLYDVMANHGKHNLKIIEYEKRQLLVLLIDETPRECKPCYNKTIGLPKGACVREGNVNRRISDEEMRAFIRYSSNYRYDRIEAKNCSLESLSNQKLTSFLENHAKKVGREFPKYEPEPKILKNLGIIDEFEGELHPTLAGYLLFAKDIPQVIEQFSRYVVRCVKYAGTSASTPIVDHLDIEGALDEQIENIHKFVLRNISIKAEIQGSKRVSSYEYPEDALREIIANSIIHRDYMNTGTYVSVCIFSDRIEISNPGNLPPGITIENIKDSQFSRNEVIARVLRDMDYMEEFGRGIDLVYARMNDFGLIEPLFKNTANMFKVTLLGGAFRSLNERQVAIWHYLQDNKSITAKFAKQLFSDISRPTINNDIKEMVDKDMIYSKGSASNTYYEARY
jgi:ATP-dependent DNA helicase RecG